MEEVKKFLELHQDSKYAILNKKLNIGVGIKSLGVRLPILRNYAKELMKKYDFTSLITNIDDEYYEEIVLKGFIIGNNQKLTYQELIKYLDSHLAKISDWSMCDSFVTSLKITNKYLDKLWPYILKKTKSKKEFEVRFALVMLLNYYINDDYKDRIYEVIQSIKREEYYVKMANAWLISYMFIAYFDDTLIFINNLKMDLWTISKGITKTIESRQISDEKKEILKKLRKKINNK